MSTPEELAVPPAPEARNVRYKYGLPWDVRFYPNDLAIELSCYLHDHKIEDGGLGAAGHFKEAAALLWGEDNDQKHFVWSPWADEMLEKSLKWKYLSVSGCASAGKSDFYAIYAIINWLADPVHTMVLITSTSLKESKGRIWGSVEEYWNAAQRKFHNLLPGKLVSSVGLIKLDDPSGEFKTSDRSGIHLIAGEKKKEKDSIGKMIGLKNSRVFFIADELPELSAAILEAAFSNLDANPFFQLIGIGNPNSIYDPHGEFSRPKGGWKTVNPSMDEWETEKGFHIRFDAYKSPNVLAGRVIYKWLPTIEKIEAKKHELGEDSIAFWRMWRSYWCPTGGTESIISEADIITFNCESTKVRWKPGTVRRLAFLDPGFTSGGDRSIAYFAELGVNEDTGLWTLLFLEYVQISENVMDPLSRNFQVVDQFKKLCEERKVQPDHAGCDNTGAAAFGDIVAERWSRQVTRVNFGGAASDRPISAHDKTRACDKYKNRVTEISCVTREFIRSNQIRGVCADLGVEWTARKMVTNKSGVDLKSLAESKEKMKSRVGFSPDIGDAANGVIEIARSKFKFKSAERAKRSFQDNGGMKKFRKKVGQSFFSERSLTTDFQHAGSSLDRAA